MRNTTKEMPLKVKSKQSTRTRIPDKKQRVAQQKKKSGYYYFFGFLLCIISGIIIYSNSFQCSFHFDDILRIVYNNKIRDLSDVSAWWNYYPSRPLGTLTFALNYHFFRLDVWYWHFFNLVIHLINTLLVWWLTTLIFCSPGVKDQPVAKYKKAIALFTALLFVSHPLATQSVTYIVQRLASLAALFYLLSAALYIKARITSKGDRNKILLMAGSIVSAILAMLVKENAFTIPFAILLIEIFFLQTKRPDIHQMDYRVILPALLFMGIIIIIPLRLSLSILKPIPASYMNIVTITPVNYLLTQFSVIVKYIQLLILPIHQNLDYDYPVSAGFFEARTMICFLLLVLLIVVAIFSFKKHRVISFGIFWFFLTLMVESSFIPIRDVIFEHRTYLPSFGFFLILSTGFFTLFRNRSVTLAYIPLIILIISYSYLTYERNKIWKDDLTLWTDIVQKSPNKSRSLYNLAMVYDYLGQQDKSIALYTRAIDNYPEDCDAYINRAVAFGNQGAWDKAITDYTKVIGIDPKLAKSFVDRGIAYSKIGQWENTIRDESKAIEIDPKNDDAFYNRGIAYGNRGQWEKAIADQTTAIGNDSGFTKAYNYRGISYANLKQWDKAIADFSKVIAIDPQNTNAYYNRGISYYNTGFYDKAISDYTQSLALDPKSANGYYNRAEAYGASGQWDNAISDYNMTITLRPDYPGVSYYRNQAFKRKQLKGVR